MRSLRFFRKFGICLSFLFGFALSSSVSAALPGSDVESDADVDLQLGIDRPIRSLNKDSKNQADQNEMEGDLNLESDRDAKPQLQNRSEKKSDDSALPRSLNQFEQSIQDRLNKQNRFLEDEGEIRSRKEKVGQENQVNTKSSSTRTDQTKSRSTKKSRALKLSDQDIDADLDEFYEEEEPSSVEAIFMGRFPDTISRDLKQFGYDVFLKREDEKPKRDSFTPLEDVPISQDYIVGPGDSFVVNVWGGSNFTKALTVRRDGSVFIPKVGVLKVAGLSYKAVEAAIVKRISSLLSGVRVHVSMDTIRSIDVFVIGEVNRPGTYSMPSTSTPMNALFHAGGAKKNGSLRNVKLLRNNKEIATIDLYDFLILGKNSGNQQLQSQDVIFVPVIGSVAAVAGNVKRPAIYELRKGDNLWSAIQMAGGLSFTGTTGRLSSERVRANKERVTRDFQIPENFNQLTKQDITKTDLDSAVEDGDFIKIFPVLDTVRGTVFLRGHAKRPGPYEFKTGMKLKDVIGSFDDLKAQPYTKFLQIVRTIPPKDDKQSLFVDLQKLFNGDESANLALQDRDQIIIFSESELNLKERVSITGKVNKPGDYYFFEGMRLRDLIYMAGNLKQEAYLANAEIARYIVKTDELKFDRIQVNLKDVFSGNEKMNPLLMPKDRILIQGIPNWYLQNFITLTGEVKFPGKYSFASNETLSSVLARAGGFTDRAFLPGAVFTRDSVRVIQEKSLKEQISRLEEALLQESAKPPSVGSSDYQNWAEASAARMSLLKNLKEVKPSGRMVIQIADLKQFKGDRYDITLEPKDTLNIPPIPSTVTIIGEVYNPTSMVFIGGKTVKYYLEKAGGTTINADNESIFVIRADGTVVSRRQNRGFLLRNFYQTEVERGDTILVPKDITRFSWLNATKDITEILFKIASTTGITITAFK